MFFITDLLLPESLVRGHLQSLTSTARILWLTTSLEVSGRESKAYRKRRATPALFLAYYSSPPRCQAFHLYFQRTKRAFPTPRNAALLARGCGGDVRRRTPSVPAQRPFPPSPSNPNGRGQSAGLGAPHLPPPSPTVHARARWGGRPPAPSLRSAAAQGRPGTGPVAVARQTAHRRRRAAGRGGSAGTAPGGAAARTLPCRAGADRRRRGGSR